VKTPRLCVGIEHVDDLLADLGNSDVARIRSQTASGEACPGTATKSGVPVPSALRGGMPEAV